MLKFLLIALLLQISLSQRTNVIDINQATTAAQTAKTNTIVNYTDIRQCSCDNYANVCELYCCCDPDCTDDIRTSWNNTNICKNEPFVKHDSICPTQDILKQLTTPRTQSSIKLRQYHTQMCIYYTDLPYMGYFIPELDRTSTITTLQKDFYKAKQDRENLITNYQSSARTTYTKGKKLWSIFTYPGTPSVTYQRFVIPTANPFGICENSNSALFLTNMPLQTCSRIVTFTADCNQNSVLSQNYYTSFVKIQKGPADVTAIPINISQYILTNSAANVSASLASGSPCMCRNVVKFVNYYIIHDNFGQITGANAVLTLENVNATSCSAQTYIEQGFSVTYVTSSNYISKSGNPGYNVGLPILIGKNNAIVVNTILRSDEGFWMKGVARDRSCITVAAGTAGSVYFPESIINFGQNSTFSCNYPVANLAAFQARCNNNQSDLLLFQNFDDTIRVGKYGNANIQYIKDWVPVETYAPQYSTQPLYDPATQTCTSPSTERISIFYKKYGKSNIPQNYIFKVVRSFDQVKTAYQSQAIANSFTYSQVVTFYDMSNIL